MRRLGYLQEETRNEEEKSRNDKLYEVDSAKGPGESRMQQLKQAA